MPIPSTLEITAATVDPALLDLPWDLPLEDWPKEILAALPRGISRHVVRFVNLSDRVIAVKEIGESVAYKEYELLRDLSRMGAPSVIPTAVITGRRDVFGEELAAVLVTEHLQFSLPYRAVFSQHMTPDTAGRLIQARCRIVFCLPRRRRNRRDSPFSHRRATPVRRRSSAHQHHR